MKGLLLKDLLLLKNYKKVLLIMAIIGVFIAGNSDISYLAGYLIVYLGVLSLSTISYDEVDHGILTLLSMPIQRKEYVQEKYIFSFLMMFFGFAIVLIVSVLKKTTLEQDFYSCVFVFCTGLVLLSLSLPFQLRYGNEKGRMILFFVIFMFVFFGYFFSEFFKEIVFYVDQINFNVFTFQCIIVAIVMYLISMIISVLVYNKREF